jgi:hypothetical protein
VGPSPSAANPMSRTGCTPTHWPAYEGGTDAGGGSGDENPPVAQPYIRSPYRRGPIPQAIGGRTAGPRMPRQSVQGRFETRPAPPSALAELSHISGGSGASCDAEARLGPSRAAVLRASAGRGSAVDALVVAVAEPGGAVLNGDLADLRALAAYADDVIVLRS